MQTLFVKQKDGSTKKVQVIRSFQDANGAHVFLHHNGTYGDRSGIPVKSADDLKTLPPNHQKLALAWWDRIGKKLSEEHYNAVNQQEIARAGDFREELAAEESNSVLDSVLYSRKPKQGAITNPKPWMEFGFAARPDWWGQAKAINFADCTYIMQNPESKKMDSE
jgi:hypothetical protein